MPPLELPGVSLPILFLLFITLLYFEKSSSFAFGIIFTTCEIYIICNYHKYLLYSPDCTFDGVSSLTLFLYNLRRHTWPTVS